jgi:hypothetical protein
MGQSKEGKMTAHGLNSFALQFLLLLVTVNCFLIL